jgi:hypothetical protein
MPLVGSDTNSTLHSLWECPDGKYDVLVQEKFGQLIMAGLLSLALPCRLIDILVPYVGDGEDKSDHSL